MVDSVCGKGYRGVWVCVLHAYVLCVCVCMCAYVRLCVSEGFFDYGKRILGRGLGLTVY